MVNIASLSSPKGNRLFNGVFIIFNLFIAGVVDFKTKRDYQNIIKNM